MANIRVDLDYTLQDGAEIKFRSPVDCSQVAGLIVYYLGIDGNITSKEFVFADAHGNNVGDIDHLFAEDVVVNVILDVTKGMAFVQNADTNAYLEAQLASKAPLSAIGTNKVFSKLTDIGITAFPTTMQTVVQAMPNNSTLILDSRHIVSGGTHEISDLGLSYAGVYMFMKGYGSSRLALLHVYSTSSGATSYMTCGGYAIDTNVVTWLRGDRPSSVNFDCRWRYSPDGKEEWINPLMEINTEYRTIEHWNNKHVYTTLFDFGALPNSTMRSVSHGISMTNCLRIAGTRTDGEMLPLHYNGKNITMYFSPAKIYVTSDFDASSNGAIIQLWYTKD